MLEKFENWIEKHDGPKLTNAISTVCSIVIPAVFGYMIYDTGRAQGKYESEKRFDNALRYAFANTEPITEVATKTE